MPEALAGRSPPRPNYLIIGAAKSGTSTLRAALDAHPEAFCAREIDYFSLHYDKGLDWYLQHFAGAADPKALGEKCPAYMNRPAALERIARDLPGVRLIAILRHPVDRAYSKYWHERREGKETLSFAEALEAEPERIKAYEAGACPFAYVEHGRYLVQLERIAQLFPDDRLLVKLFDDLGTDPGAMFADVCRFLDIDPTVRPSQLDRTHNPYRTHRPAWLWRLMERGRLWKLMPHRTRVRVAHAMLREERYEPMAPGMRRHLLEVFADANAALARRLGRDLSAWET
jgi:hypothetical protein